MKPSKRNEIYYKDEIHEIFVDGKYGATIKKDNKYYFIHDQKQIANLVAGVSPTTAKNKKYLDNIYASILGATMILFVYETIYIIKQSMSTTNNYQHTSNNYIMLIGIIIFNIVLHEMGHMVVLKSYGRKINGFGFKMRYLFPAIYVNTSDAYMLSKRRRLFVYTAGNVVNIHIIFIMIYFLKADMFYTYTIYALVIFNMLPLMLKNDGYHVLMLLMNGGISTNRGVLVKYISRLIFIVMVITLLIKMMV